MQVEVQGEVQVEVQVEVTLPPSQSFLSDFRLVLSVGVSPLEGYLCIGLTLYRVHSYIGYPLYMTLY